MSLDLFTVFGPSPLPPERVIACVLTVLEDDGGTIGPDYAEVRRDAYTLGRDTFDVVGEVHDLAGHSDLLARVRTNASGQASLAMRRFAGDRIRVIVFVDPPGGASTTLVLDGAAASSSDASPIARLILGRPEHERERDDAVALIERVAAAIGADYFFAGTSLIEWRRMPVERLLSGPDVDFAPALIAWRAGLFSRGALARAWGFDATEVVRGAREFERVWVRAGR